MEKIQRLPAIPLITADPYFSVWSCADRPTDTDTQHWTGERKRLEISVRTQNGWQSLVGKGEKTAAELVSSKVSPTITQFDYQGDDVSINLSFCSPLLLDDMELFSTPITLMRLTCKEKNLPVKIIWHDDICYNGTVPPPIKGTAERRGSLYNGMMGKQRQGVLSHSGDRICIDWGYAWMTSDIPVAFSKTVSNYALSIQGETHNNELWVLFAYDDVASIDYFGLPCKSWSMRNGKNIQQALKEFWQKKESIWQRCEAFDKTLEGQAQELGGEAYQLMVCASYRHVIAAHKLISDENKKPVFLSKENDSNGCIGTVDVSYPSIPLFLLFNPELVKAMCRPILRFAELPVWKYDFAPHDVGRYPHATGQVYSLNLYDYGWDDNGGDGVYLPYYLLGENSEVYTDSRQMPVEECANMILMLAAALKVDGDLSLIKQHEETLRQWVKYLENNGKDPGEQLCTDDFAGHLAHNVNLAIKAICGIAAFGFICEKMGCREEAELWREKAQEMAKYVQRKSERKDHSALTLDGDEESWSLKYNAVWDLLFDFHLLPAEWYEKEVRWYFKKENAYGIPLDNRKDYTKSDWTMWTAIMSKNREEMQRFCTPVAKFLLETTDRVPFSDWYDTKTGNYIHFIARSVQGGIFMPLLYQKWKSKELSV